MDTKVNQDVNKKCIQSTLYNPCISNDDNSDKLSKLKEHFAAKSSLVGIVAASCSNTTTEHYVNTPHGKFVVGSTLGHQLCLFDESFEYITTTEKLDNNIILTEENFPDLPMKNIDYNS